MNAYARDHARGQWAAALRSRGAKVDAFDDWSQNGGRGPPDQSALQVRTGNETKLQEPDMQHRSLLLVYPPPGDMATKCLAAYRGNTLIYVGEGRGGVCADASFFDAMDRNWVLKEKRDLDPFPGAFERMYVFRRKSSGFLSFMAW